MPAANGIKPHTNGANGVKSLPKACKRHDRTSHASDTEKPYFQKSPSLLPEGGFLIHDEAFLNILGPSPKIECILHNEAYPFAHEAGVYIPSTGEVFITSNQFEQHGKKKVQISKIVPPSSGNDSYRCIEIDSDIELANGAVNSKSDILFCEQGTMTSPGGLTLMSSTAPYSTTQILTNFHGRWFNSTNDVIVSQRDGSIWFTDPKYGFEQNIRPRPVLPNMVYRFDPRTGDVRAVAEGLGKPNGLCFDPAEEVLYVTDTAAIEGVPCVFDGGRAACIHAYDIIYRHSSPFLANKRLFAFASCGVPDGMKCDIRGNVYSGCGDGVHVWSPGGIFLGKITLPTGSCANFCFGKEGEMFLLNETRVWRVKMSGEGVRGALLGV